MTVEEKVLKSFASKNVLVTGGAYTCRRV